MAGGDGAGTEGVGVAVGVGDEGASEVVGSGEGEGSSPVQEAPKAMATQRARASLIPTIANLGRT
jgi:hypothetical protein